MRAHWPLFVVVVTGGCARPAATSVSGPPSAPGWAIRYNAALALANRGSDAVTADPVVQDLLIEMMDYEQQLRNARVEVRPGVEAVNTAEAGVTVAGAIHALGEFHRSKPQADLTPFRPALDKLAAGPERTLAREAKGLIDAAWPHPP
jgi:hypothetical protein